MTSTIAIHSFRRGTGKSTVAANLAVLLADSGRRVGLIDANFQSPSLHLFFGQLSLGHRPALNDYLAGRCDLQTLEKSRACGRVAWGPTLAGALRGLRQTLGGSDPPLGHAHRVVGIPKSQSGEGRAVHPKARLPFGEQSLVATCPGGRTEVAAQ